MRRRAASVRVGALAPLTPPGWVSAGRHLRAGLELAVHEVNSGGGIAGRRLELTVVDTAADPGRAAAAVDELAREDVVAVVGEYHSVAARAAAARADALGLPFLCSSAVIDTLVAEPSEWIARLAPPQSLGWRIYVDHLIDAGHTRIAVATEPSLYWEAGTRILRDRLAPLDGAIVELDARGPAPTLNDELVARGASALLLLLGHPEPAVSIVRSVRGDARLSDILIGAPAGQPEFSEWETLLGPDGAAIPFLRYMPEALGPVGLRVEAAVRQQVAGAPSFVALEGHDAITVLAEILREHGTSRAGIAEAWPGVAVEGTRGRIQFTRAASTGTWQWPSPPVQIADRDPASPDRLRTLRAAGMAPGFFGTAADCRRD